MEDLSEAFAEINAERMGDAVRKNTRFNPTPRFLPSSSREGKGSGDRFDDDPPSSLEKEETIEKEVPVATSAMKAVEVYEYTRHNPSWCDNLSYEEIEFIKGTLVDNSSFKGYIQTRPMECVLGSSIVAIVVGVLLGMMLFSPRDTSNYFRGGSEASSTSKRVVDRMLDYI